MHSKTIRYLSTKIVITLESLSAASISRVILNVPFAVTERFPLASATKVELFATSTAVKPASKLAPLPDVGATPSSVLNLKPSFASRTIPVHVHV